MNRFGLFPLFPVVLLCPAMLAAGTDFSFTAPANNSTVTVTPNQALPVLMAVRNTNSGLAAFIPLEYVAQATVTPTCPPAANPCANHVGSTGAVAPFVLMGQQSFIGAITTITFQSAPAGFYTIKVAVTINGCVTTNLNCTAPDNFVSSIQFTVQVVSVIGGPANALAHFAVGGPFVTDLFVINNSSQAAQFSISFYTDSGSPASLPFSGFGILSTLSDALPGFGTGFYEAGDPKAPTQGGWALIKADPSITIQELFRNRTSDGTYFEAAVPAYPGSKGFRIPFDASTFTPTGDTLYTGFAIANLDPINPANVTCTARDFRGNVIPNAINVPALNPLGHWANYLFPALTGARGTIECSSNTLIAGLGLRFIGTNTFSSLPVITE